MVTKPTRPDGNHSKDAGTLAGIGSNPRSIPGLSCRSCWGIHAQTEYGHKYGVEHAGSIADYRAKFPIATYDDFKPSFNG